jgi:outer membrane receptor protein involved in Fe transport
MSGVLELQTLDPPAGREFALGLSAFDALALSAGRFGAGRGAWLVSARRGSLALAREAVGDESPRFWDVFGKAELATAVGQLSARVLTAGDHLEIDATTVDGFERLDNDYRSTHGWLTHRAAPNPRLLIETSGSWAEIRRVRGGAGGDEEGIFELCDRSEVQVLALAQSFSLQPRPHHALAWGWEARRYDAFFDYAKELEPAFPVLAPFAPPRRLTHRFEGSLRGSHAGFWVSDRTRWRGRLTTELGLRYDRHGATGDRLLSPRVSLAWRIGERGVVRGAWGRFFQSQRPYELQVEDGETSLFAAERSEHWVAGYESLPRPNRLGIGAVRIELFGRAVANPRPRYENLLEPLNFFQEVEPDRVRFAPERGSAKGLELLLRGSRGERCDWFLAYAYARAQETLAGAHVPRSLDQPHTVAADLDWRLPRQWNLNFAWRWHSGWPTTPVAARLLPDPEDPEAEPQLAAEFGELNSERLPAYHRLDLRASRRWRLPAGELTFFADLQNVYHRRNLKGFTIDLDPDAGTVDLAEEDWPGIFPSLGLTWEF